MHKFTHKVLANGAALSLFLFGAACNEEEVYQDDDPNATVDRRYEQEDMQDPGATPPGGGVTKGETDPNAMTLDATRFVEQAASSGMFEVESAQLITDTDARQEVADFAQTLIDDHQTANDRLKEIAQNAGITVPERMSPEHQQKLERLRGLDAQQLEQQFVDVQVQAHQQAVDLFRRASEQLQKAELKTFAKETLPKLESHLETARKLQNNR